MSKIVLCMDNGNPCLEKTKEYLKSQDCMVYTLPEREEDIYTLLEDIRQNKGRIDLLLLSANDRIPEDGVIGMQHDCDALLQMVGDEINRTEQVIQASLPLLRQGELKRIGMITRKDSSISYCRSDRDYGQHMVWAGLNMMGKLYFNMLRPEGFTFRWYCAEEGEGGMAAGEYLLTGLCYDAGEPYLHSDENRFVMRDSYLREIPW